MGLWVLHDQTSQTTLAWSCEWTHNHGSLARLPVCDLPYQQAGIFFDKPIFCYHDSRNTRLTYHLFLFLGCIVQLVDTLHLSFIWQIRDFHSSWSSWRLPGDLYSFPFFYPSNLASFPYDFDIRPEFSSAFLHRSAWYGVERQPWLARYIIQPLCFPSWTIWTFNSYRL